MKMPMHIMIDLETMGTRPGAPIVSIGAVRFDQNQIWDEYYVTVDLDSAVEGGGVMDAHTVLWWMNQSEAARAELTGEGQEIEPTLNDFRGWVDATCHIYDFKGMWGNGANFDNVILAETYRRAGMAVPWPFWMDKCYRTVKGMYPDVQLERVGTHHNALSDAKSQAEHLIRINKAAGGVIL